MSSNLLYVQSTGQIFDARQVFAFIPELETYIPQPLAQGYSGTGADKNRPASESNNLGPIPTGLYGIRPVDIDELNYAIQLVPGADNEMYDRSGFLIYGDDNAPAWASEGSIVINGATNRQKILGYDQLQVIRATPVPLQSLHKTGMGVVVVNDGDRPFFLGRGYKTFAAKSGTFSKEFGEPVITADSPVLPPTGSMAQMSFGVLASKQDFESAFSVDAELSGGYGALSAKAQASLTKSYSQDLTTVTIAFTKQVVRGVYRINFEDCTIDPEALRATRTASDYVRIYGDSVVTGVGVGGACCYMFRYVFSSETEASDFKTTLGASYGTVSGSVSNEQKTLMSTAHANISLSGYSTGTTNVPELVKNSGVFLEQNFVFSSAFSDEIMRNLIEFFDNFESNFADQTSQNYTQVFVDPTPLSMLEVPQGFRNEDEILRISARATQMAVDLARRLQVVDALQNQLAYMQNVVAEYNTPQSLDQAKILSQQLVPFNDAIDARLTSLLDLVDLDPYEFDIRSLPKAFCTIDPELRQYGDQDVMMNTWIIYPFSDTDADHGRTCRVEAMASFYVAGNNTGFGDATIRLLKKKRAGGRPMGPTPVSDTETDWNLVEQQYCRTGRDQGARFMTVPSRPPARTPFPFIVAPDEIFAVGLYFLFKLSGHAITLKTYLSRQAPLPPLFVGTAHARSHRGRRASGAADRSRPPPHAARRVRTRGPAGR
jgi:hypothetical protein